MKPSHARLLCRSQNPFTPSIALWQHFVLLGRPFVHHQRPAYSTLAKDEPFISPEFRPNHVQTPTTIQDVLDEENSTDELSSPPPAPSIRPVYNSLPQDRGRSRRFKTLDVPQSRNIDQSDPNIQRTRRAWVSYRRDVDVEADPNSLQAFLVQTQNTVDKTGDYQGVVMKTKPVKDKRHLRESNLPWAFQLVDTSRHEEDVDLNVPSMERLEVEMMRFHEYMMPSRAEALARRQLIEQVSSHAHEVLPDAEFEVFGSERTGLAFATSDIDLRLVPKMEEIKSNVLPPRLGQRKRLLKKIHRLFRYFRKRSQYEHCAVLHARYPLLNLRDKSTGLVVQIVLSNDTSTSRAMIRKYIDEYPFIRPVYSVVKAMLDIRGLSDTFRGGFGSYPIFMMIVASFRHCQWDTPPASAGEGLKAFIDFWTVFDTTEKGISLEPTELYDKDTNAPMTDTARRQLLSGGTKPVPGFCLSLRDPADPTNDLGRKGVAIKHLQVTLGQSIQAAFHKRLFENKDPSLLHPLVTPVYGLTIDEKKKLRERGIEISNNTDHCLFENAKQIREASTSTHSDCPQRVVSLEPLEASKLGYDSFSAGDTTSILGMPSAAKANNIGGGARERKSTTLETPVEVKTQDTIPAIPDAAEDKELEVVEDAQPGPQSDRP